jgi:hypothetical protein
MTDERAQGEPPAPDPGTPPEPPQPPSEPLAQGEPPPPPPLAPLVNQSGAASGDQASDTTVQPTSTWEQPAFVPPPIPPPQAQQPAVNWSPPPAPASTAGQRTTLSMVAGILLIVGGVLGTLAGLAVAAFGSAFISSIERFGPIPELEGMNVETFLSGFVVFLGIIIIAYSLVYLIAGIGVVRSRDWGRVLGLIVGILSGLVWLGGLGGRQGSGDSIGGSLVALAIHAYIVVALLFFWRTKPSTA